MDLVKLSIPWTFVRKNVHLAWRDILFGIDNELLDPDVPIEMATDQIATSESPSAVLIELAGLGKGERSRDLVKQLATTELDPESSVVHDKWLYLVLAWVYEHRAEYSDPLEVVEKIYADFGYPPRIACFVRYMPTCEPDLGSQELNEQRLYEKWKQYLEEASVNGEIPDRS